MIGDEIAPVEIELECHDGKCRDLHGILETSGHGSEESSSLEFSVRRAARVRLRKLTQWVI